MGELEVKEKSEKCARNRDILSDLFFEFPTGRKWVFWIADFGVVGAVRGWRIHWFECMRRLIRQLDGSGFGHASSFGTDL